MMDHEKQAEARRTIEREKTEHGVDDGREPIMRYFSYTHLPEPLRGVSARFAALAEELHLLPRCAERSVALRKLLESKDAAVRAAL